MNINRHNYEEFFLLYIDNELSAAERNAVEVFVQENADLKEELVILQQTVIDTDAVVFENKIVLLKEEVSPLQENLLLYLDDELSAADKLTMQQLLNTDAVASKEFTLLQQTQLQPDTTIVFAKKKSLYRKEEGRVVRIPWFRIAAAAILLGFGVWVTVSVVNTKKATDKNNVAAKTETKITPATQSAANTTVNTQQESVKNTNDVNTTATNNTSAAKQVPPKNNQPAENISKQNSLKGNNNNTIALKVENKKPGNNLPQPDYNNFNNSESNKTALAAVTQTDKAIEKINSGNVTAITPSNDKTTKETINTYALNTNFTQGDAEENNNNKILYMDEDNVKKSKLGGFFRKVKRLVERNTDIKTGNCIKVAGLDIAIK